MPNKKPKIRTIKEIEGMNTQIGASIASTENITDRQWQKTRAAQRALLWVLGQYDGPGMLESLLKP